MCVWEPVFLQGLIYVIDPPKRHPAAHCGPLSSDLPPAPTGPFNDVDSTQHRLQCALGSENLQVGVGHLVAGFDDGKVVRG